MMHKRLTKSQKKEHRNSRNAWFKRMGQINAKNGSYNQWKGNWWYKSMISSTLWSSRFYGPSSLTWSGVETSLITYVHDSFWQVPRKWVKLEVGHRHKRGNFKQGHVQAQRYDGCLWKLAEPPEFLTNWLVKLHRRNRWRYHGWFWLIPADLAANSQQIYSPYTKKATKKHRWEVCRWFFIQKC